MSWPALGRDPVPGDPGAVRTLANRFDAVRDAAEAVVGGLRTVDSGTGSAVWRGPAAESFRDLLADAGPAVTRLSSSHGIAHDALLRYATALERAQETARRAETDGERAIADRDDARRRQGAADADAGSWASRARAAQAQWLEGQSKRAACIADPVYAAQLDAWLHEIASRREHFRTCESQARGRAAGAAREADAADDRLSAARALATQAARDREDAADRLADELDRASPKGDGWKGVLDAIARHGGDAIDFAGDVVGGLADKVRPYVNGKGGVRWAKGYGVLREKFQLSASTVRNVDDILDGAGKVATFVQVVDDGTTQWFEDSADHPGRSNQEKAFRVGGAVVATTGTDLLIGRGAGAAGAAIGGAIGTLIPVPVVGTVAGAVIGAGIGLGASWVLEETGAKDAIRQFGAGAGSAVYEEFTDVANTASSVIEGATDTAGDIWEGVTKWRW